MQIFSWKPLLVSAIVAQASIGCVINRERVSRTTVSPLFDARPYEKIAVVVMDQAGQLQQSGEMRQVEDAFLTELIGKGYIVATRSDIESLLSEIAIQMSGFTEYDAVRIGRMISARAIVLISINSSNKTISISARMLDTKRAQILWVSSYTGAYSVFLAGPTHISSEMTSVAKAIAKEFPVPRAATEPQPSTGSTQKDPPRSPAPASKPAPLAQPRVKQ